MLHHYKPQTQLLYVRQMILYISFNKAPWRRDGKEKNLREKFVKLVPEFELKN